jgi:7-carboxy-7-deazaguanine synthase
MTFSVKEMYVTLQGEGAHTGRAAVFCRFAGCNLWTGREADRESAVCRFCDTEFVGTDGPGGGTFADPDSLARAIAALWRGGGREGGRPFVVFTGGEPLLQLDEPLTSAVRSLGFEVAVETNGTKPRPPGIDWLCVSPKAGADLVLSQGDELKLVFPQIDLPPDRVAHLAFTHFFLQPMDGPGVAEHTRLAAAYCLAHPQWRLGLQTHKIVGLP